MFKNFFKKYYIYIILVFIILLAIILLYIWMNEKPKIALNGDSFIALNLYDEYKEEGASSTIHGKDISKYIKIEGNVDTNKVGIYKITYRIKYNKKESIVIRNVQVVDSIKPIIELKGNKEVYLCVQEEYKEDGFSATDNIDGDISSKVKVKIEDDQVLYEVEDNFGNKAYEVRKLIRKDVEKPKITLTGGNNLTVIKNSEYKELGYKAYDNCLGDITKKVIVSGSVDTTKTGTYQIIYKVEDSSGNSTSVKRIVNVIDSSKAGIIYLTFDDGPKNGTTNVILDILKEEGVKATFFVTNGGPDSLVKREFEEGHTVALHTATHDYQKVYSSVDAYFNDLKIVEDRVKRITEIESKIIRFPGGSSNTVSKRYCKGIMSKLIVEVVNRGYHYFDWNISSGDAGETNVASKVYQNVISHLSHNRMNVVLLHDTKAHTRDALKDIIEYGKSHGYKFEVIDYNTPMVTHNVAN